MTLRKELTELSGQKTKCEVNMAQTQEQIWHCPCQPDRDLAEILVKQQMPWKELADHFGKPYPYTLADKYDLVYRLLGCKKD